MNTKVIIEISDLRTRIPTLAIEHYGNRKDSAVWIDLFTKEKEYMLARTAVIISEWLDTTIELDKACRDKWYSRLIEVLKWPSLVSLVSFAIKQMKYQDFLRTPYWKVVSQQVREDAGNKCQICNDGSKTLHVHHRNYSIHGMEHDNLKDLICLCEDCHAKFHNKEVHE